MPIIDKFSYEDSAETGSFFLAYSWEVVFRCVIRDLVFWNSIPKCAFSRTCSMSWNAERVAVFDTSVLDSRPLQNEDSPEDGDQPNEAQPTAMGSGQDADNFV